MSDIGGCTTAATSSTGGVVWDHKSLAMQIRTLSERMAALENRGRDVPMPPLPPLDVPRDSAKDFGWALKQMRNGNRVRRKNWMELFTLVIFWPTSDYQEHFVFKADIGNSVPWSPSHADLLATDWELA